MCRPRALAVLLACVALVSPVSCGPAPSTPPTAPPPTPDEPAPARPEEPIPTGWEVVYGTYGGFSGGGEGWTIHCDGHVFGSRRATHSAPAERTALRRARPAALRSLYRAMTAPELLATHHEEWANMTTSLRWKRGDDARVWAWEIGSEPPAAVAAAYAAAVETATSAEEDRETPRPPADVEVMLAHVSPERLGDDLRRLAAFGTRHSLSETASETRGIGAARRWLRGRFEDAAKASGRTGDEALRVDFDTHVAQPGRRVPVETEIVNVRCVIPGSMPEAAGRLYYAVAHYDSRATDALDAESDAPGANDDGSGTVALLELARVLAPLRFDATIVLMPVAGEEQGLIGSRLHARAAQEAGADVRAVLSSDMIGDPSGLPGGGREAGARHEVRVFSEGLPRGATPEQLANLAALGAESDSASRQLARYVADVAELHHTTVRPRLVFRNDRFLRGGDHTAFTEQGYAAVRLTDVHEKYARQHQDLREEDGVRYGDTPDHVDTGYLADVTRLNAAVLAHLARAPSSPRARMVIAALDDGTTLRWEPSPEPDVAGYEVVWRETTSPVWQHSRDVGDVSEARVELSRDNWLFGVRAYDRDGYRSPVAYPSVARE